MRGQIVTATVGRAGSAPARGAAAPRRSHLATGGSPGRAAGGRRAPCYAGGVSRSRRRLLIALAVVAGVAALWLAGPRYRVEPYRPAALALPAGAAEVPRWLAAREAAVPGVRPGLHKGVRWAGAEGQRTALCVVYLHGFSASRGELSPVVEDVGAALGANVLFTRLAGHGQDGAALARAQVAQWKADADEALALARLLGERVAIVGMSTGGTLATWLAARTPDLHALVLLSPNFGTKRSADAALGPWGPQLLRLIVGGHRSIGLKGELVERRWTTRYPSAALLPMFAFVREVSALDLAPVAARTLLVYGEDDEVLDIGRMKARFQDVGAARKRIVGLKARHVLAGEAAAPENSERVTALIRDFLREAP